MKMLKKVTSLFLTTILVLATFAVSGVSVSATKYSGSYGQTNWEFDDSTNTLTFSGGGNVDSESVSSYASRTENIVLKSTVRFSSYYADDFPQLKNISADENHNEYTTVDGVLFDKEMETIYIYPSKKPGSSYSIPNGVVNIENYAFLNCTELTEIKIPDSVRKVGILDTFKNSGCYNNLSNWDNNVLYIDNCIVEVTYSRNPISGFYNIRPGTRMILSDGIVTNSGDDDNIVNLNKLTGLSIPDSVTFIGGSGALDYSDFLKDPRYWYEGACYLDNWLLDVDNNFSGHLKIKEGTRYILGEVLSDCNNLTAITIPGSVKSIPQLSNIFCSVNKTISDIYINEGVEVIEDHAFYNFGGLKNISFPKSLKKIDAGCFFVFSTDDEYYNGAHLSKITFSYAGTMEDWKKVEIVDNYANLKERTIHCTDGIINEPEPVPTYEEQNNIPIPLIFILIVIIILVIFIITKLRVKKKKEKEFSKEYKTLQ